MLIMGRPTEYKRTTRRVAIQHWATIGTGNVFSKQTDHSAETGRSFNDSGIASVYGGQQTASGETMNSGDMTAAHRTLPFGTKVTVVNHNNGRSAVVRINDRGPFVRDG